jgi:gliding motility-associated lipoprotein GldH
MVKSPYYQKQVPIPGAAWSYAFQPTFKVQIDDTASRYQLYLLLRHDEAYPNANIWFRIKVKAPGDTTYTDGARIEKTLADPEGKWLARGMSGIWEHKIPLAASEGPDFKQMGMYEIKVEQVMRRNPLPSVLNIGLIVEKR